MIHDLTLFLHVVGACVLLGTGAGIAFFMAASNRSGDPALIAHTAGIVVLADAVFTATAALLQPVTGYLLARQAGWPLSEPWILAAIGLYLLRGNLLAAGGAGCRVRLRRLAAAARDAGQPLPAAYHRLYRIWFACGLPAFAAVLAIVWLMVAKPSLG